MKLLQKQLTKEGPGWVKMVPEEGKQQADCGVVGQQRQAAAAAAAGAERRSGGSWRRGSPLLHST